MGLSFITSLVNISLVVPDLDKTLDETLVTFFLILGLPDFFLDAKRSVNVFLVQS